ncbi:MAG: HAMP domain-containing protein [Sorangiineae bacterium]|nr:HAMP domain-containing protein [Polyangiaceae bacterium]MEB2324877.1 HAMP domain-containing protein [Sorangiineae bacterium]
MAEAATRAAPADGRRQRRLRNYLLDSRFQLKYAGYMVGIALVLSVALGLILWRTSQAVIAQSHQAVNQGEQVVARGREVVEESRKVSAVVQMNIVKDPVYSDNPALLEAFKTDAKTQDDRLKKQQEALETQATALKQQSAALAERQRTMFISLFAILALLVFGVGVAGIVITHKVAGPIFKMKRQIGDVAEGRLKIPSKLRKGDELVDFFEAFEAMVISLRTRQEGEIGKLELALGKLEGKADDDVQAPLHALLRDMKAALD